MKTARIILRLLLCLLAFSFKAVSATNSSKSLPLDLNVGFLYPPIQSQVSRSYFETTVTLWLEEVTRSVKPIPINIKLYDSVEIMSDDFDQGKLSLIVGPPYTLAKHFQRANLAEGLAGTTPKRKPNGLIIVARNDQKINSPGDFQNQRLVIPYHNELAEVYLDTLSYKTFRQPYLKTFKSIQRQFQYSQPLYDIFFGKSDLAVTYAETYDLMLELNPQLQDKLKIVSTFPLIAPNYGYFHAKYPAYYRELWLQNALKLNDSPKAQAVLLNLKIGSLTRCQVDELNRFDQLLEEYQKLKKGKK